MQSPNQVIDLTFQIYKRFLNLTTLVPITLKFSYVVESCLPSKWMEYR